MVYKDRYKDMRKDMHNEARINEILKHLRKSKMKEKKRVIHWEAYILFLMPTLLAGFMVYGILDKDYPQYTYLDCVYWGVGSGILMFIFCHSLLCYLEGIPLYKLVTTDK